MQDAENVIFDTQNRAASGIVQRVRAQDLIRLLNVSAAECACFNTLIGSSAQNQGGSHLSKERLNKQLQDATISVSICFNVRTFQTF